jgi:large subunit ribosomal protein L9
MQVVLRDDVDNLGRKGDLVEVRDGYARNYLVPRGLAIRATRGTVAQAEAMRRNREAREERERGAAREEAARLAGTTLQIVARAGEGGKLFGSVTAADLVAALHERVGVELDRRRVELAEPVKELGELDVDVRLHRDVVVTLHVEVVAEA